MVVEHRINWDPKDESPVYVTPYQGEPRQRQLWREDAENNFEVTEAEPTLAEWATRIEFVSKKDMILKVRFDYLSLIKVAICGRYITQTMNECMDFLEAPNIFPMLDSRPG